MTTTLGPVGRAAKLNTVRTDYNKGFFRGLFYGPSGVGKTVLTATAADVPDMCPILFCDADMGTLSIVNRTFDVVPIKTIKDVENVNKYIRAHPGEYKTVVVDGLTALYNQIIRQRLVAPGRTDNEDPYVPSQRDWMHGTFRLRVVIQMLKTAPVNFLATALVDERIDEFSGAKVTRPGLSNKLAQEVGAEFDIVGYLSVKMQVKKATRILQLEPFGGRIAKNRSIYILPAALEDPTMPLIYGASVLGLSLEDLRKEAVSDSELPIIHS